MTDEKQTQPPQHQDQRPGSEEEMTPAPIYLADTYRPAGKLQDRVAVITGADSGIGRAVAVHFALEGAKIVLLYLNEYQDAEVTREEIEKHGGQVIDFAGDVAGEDFCRTVVQETLKEWGRIDILVNNAGEQHPQKSLDDISPEQWEKTFRTNIFGMYQLTRAVLPHLKSGAAIVNTTSITAYKGNPTLLDYSSTKGAIDLA